LFGRKWRHILIFLLEWIWLSIDGVEEESRFQYYSQNQFLVDYLAIYDHQQWWFDDIAD
jgi:hypothetical protein